MDEWHYDAEMGRQEQRIPVFAAGSYLGQIEELGMGHTQRGDPKLAITFRVWTGHPTLPGSVSRTVNEHLVREGNPHAVRLSARRSIELEESLGMQGTGKIPLAGLKGQWVGVVLTDKVETITTRDGGSLTTPVNRIKGYVPAQAATGPHDPSQAVIHPAVARPAAPPAPPAPAAPHPGHAPPAPAGIPPAGLPPAPGYAAPGHPSGQLGDDGVPY